MSYPVYPSFTPHSVLDWGSYHDPLVKHAFDSVAPAEAFFSDVSKMYEKDMIFSAGTPAILHDDGISYVAVGHVRANAFCFHGSTNVVKATCADWAAYRDKKSKKGQRVYYAQESGKNSGHYSRDYAMFFYRLVVPNETWLGACDAMLCCSPDV